MRMILTNILQGKKYGVVQTDSPISRDFLFLTIQLGCSDRINPPKKCERPVDGSSLSYEMLCTIPQKGKSISEVAF